MKIRLDYVSVSVAGDYYQVGFDEKKEDKGGETFDAPYVIIQRQFEMPDGSRIYIETHDEDYIGHVRVIRGVLSPNRLFLKLQRKKASELEVTFNTSKHTYIELKEALRTMIPGIDLREQS